LPHVSGENIVSGTSDLMNLRSAKEDGMTSGKYLFEAGDVLYSKLRPYLRKATLAPCRGLCSADMYPIRVKRSLLDAEFATWLLLSRPFTEYAVAKSERSRMPKLNREQLFAWETPLAPVAYQTRAALHLKTKLQATESYRNVLSQRLNGIHQLPRALLRQVFNGTI
jgi:type I restriction enzyme S subunit